MAKNVIPTFGPGTQAGELGDRVRELRDLDSRIMPRTGAWTSSYNSSGLLEHEKCFMDSAHSVLLYHKQITYSPDDVVIGTREIFYSGGKAYSDISTTYQYTPAGYLKGKNVRDTLKPGDKLKYAPAEPHAVVPPTPVPVDHAGLSNLDYASAAHTGFSPDTHNHALNNLSEKNHSSLNQKDYASAGHTGFSPDTHLHNSTYLKLDCSNDPLTGNLEIEKTAPSHLWTDETGESLEIGRGPGNLAFIKNGTLSVGVTGYAVNFGGVASNRIQVTHNAAYDFGTGDFSISMPIKRNATGGVEVFLANCQGTAGTYGFRFYFNGAANKIACNLYSTTGNVGLTSTGTIADTNWHTFLFVADRDGNGTFYIDNVAAGSASIAAAAGSLNNAVGANIMVGSSYTLGQGVNAAIDEVGFFTKVLDATERTREYGSGSGYYHDGTESGLVLLLHVDENTGTTTVESKLPQSCNITSGSWVGGLVNIVGSMHDNIGLQIYDGITVGEYAIVEAGYDDCRFVANGKTHEWWIDSVLVFTLQADGTLHAETADYETLVTDDDDIPNKKYVDDADALNLPLAGGTLSGNLLTDSDIEITDTAKGIILKSPDGTRWRITIDNAGALVTTSL